MSLSCRLTNNKATANDFNQVILDVSKSSCPHSAKKISKNFTYLIKQFIYSISKTIYWFICQLKAFCNLKIKRLLRMFNKIPEVYGVTLYANHVNYKLVS